ncbi:MAG: hypothetical protein ACFB6R_12955 [Alphaproteobacteria bacterium]
MTILKSIRGGDVVLFYRGDSPNIHCRLRKPKVGGWVQRSTKTKCLEVAIERAEEWHDDLRFKERYGLALNPKTFSAVCDLYIRELRDEVAAGSRSERHLRDYIPVVERYLRPYFGERQIDEIKSSHIGDYRRWRLNYWQTGPGRKLEYIEYERAGKKIRRPAPKPRPPSQTTLNQEDVVLRRVFDVAVRHDILKPFQVPSINPGGRSGRRTDRRPHFTVQEYRKLMSFMEEWVQQGSNTERRLLLRDYIRFLVHTGIRPGTETDNLCWRHITNMRTPEGRFRQIIIVNGKTGSREVIGVPEAGQAIREIRQRFDAIQPGKGWPTPEPSPDSRVFMLPDETPVPHDYLRGLFDKALTQVASLGVV